MCGGKKERRGWLIFLSLLEFNGVVTLEKRRKRKKRRNHF